MIGFRQRGMLGRLEAGEDLPVADFDRIDAQYATLGLVSVGLIVVTTVAFLV